MHHDQDLERRTESGMYKCSRNASCPPTSSCSQLVLLCLAFGIYALAQSALRRIPPLSGQDHGEADGSRLAQPALLPVAWALMAAVSAGYTALFFKCIAQLIAGAAMGGGTPFWQCWETYVLVAAAFSCAPSELHCLNLALQSGEAISVVPMYLSMGMLAQLTTGAVFFQEFKDFKSTRDMVKFAASVAFTLCSVVAMAKARADSTPVQPCEESTAKTPLLQIEIPEPSALMNMEIMTPCRGVSVAGFGGAIESIDAWRRDRCRTLPFSCSQSGSLPTTPSELHNRLGRLQQRAGSAPA